MTAAAALFNSLFIVDGTHFGLGWPVAETLLPVLGRRLNVSLLVVLVAVPSPSLLFSGDNKISAGMDDEAVVDDRRTFLSHFILVYARFMELGLLGFGLC